MALDLLARRYGKAPHEYMQIDDTFTAFDYAVMTKARSVTKE